MNNRIKLLRNSLKLSQREFGEKLGVSRDVISNIEYGRVQPKNLMLNHICDLYNVEELWLKKGTGAMFKPSTTTNERVKEALSIFQTLSPELQDCAIAQIKQLAELQRIQNSRK